MPWPKTSRAGSTVRRCGPSATAPGIARASSCAATGSAWPAEPVRCWRLRRRPVWRCGRRRTRVSRRPRRARRPRVRKSKPNWPKRKPAARRRCRTSCSISFAATAATSPTRKRLNRPRRGSCSTSVRREWSSRSKTHRRAGCKSWTRWRRCTASSACRCARSNSSGGGSNWRGPRCRPTTRAAPKRRSRWRGICSRAPSASRRGR